MSTAPADTSRDGDGYTVVLRQPRPTAQAADVDARIRDLLATTATRAGYLGAVVVDGASQATPELLIVARFTDADAWRAWRADAEVSGWLADLAAITGARPAPQYAEGIASWFDLPGTTTVQAPAKWKMALVTWGTILPLLLLSNLVLAPLSVLPAIVRLILGTAITTPVMTWLAMPAVTKLLRGWLYGNPAGA